MSYIGSGSQMTSSGVFEGVARRSELYSLPFFLPSSSTSSFSVPVSPIPFLAHPSNLTQPHLLAQLPQGASTNPQCMSRAARKQTASTYWFCDEYSNAILND